MFLIIILMSKKINQDFINALKNWVNLENTISANNAEVKNLKEKRDLLEQNILKYIKVNGLEQTKLNLGNISLLYNETCSLAPLSQTLIVESLREYLKNQRDVDNICEIIKRKRENNRKTNISLKKKKVNKKNK